MIRVGLWFVSTSSLTPNQPQRSFVSGWNNIHQITVDSVIHWHITSKRNIKLNELNWKTEALTVGKVHKAIFWPTPGVTAETFNTDLWILSIGDLNFHTPSTPLLDWVIAHPIYNAPQLDSLITNSSEGEILFQTKWFKYILTGSSARVYT